MNIQELETAEIIRLITELNAELKSRAKAEKKQLIAEIQEKAEGLNIPVLALLEEANKLAKRRTSLVKPKYCNPDNEAERWTGRGRQPKWVVSQLEKGKTLEDMLIQEESN